MFVTTSFVKSPVEEGIGLKKTPKNRKPKNNPKPKKLLKLLWIRNVKHHQTTLKVHRFTISSLTLQ